MGSMSIMHWMIVIAVVVLLFGRGKISGLMGDVADGIKSFKRGMREEEPGPVTVPSQNPIGGRAPLLAASQRERAHAEVQTASLSAARPLK